MVPKIDMFVLIRNAGSVMNKMDEHWSMILHRGGGERVRYYDGTSSGDFMTLKTP